MWSPSARFAFEKFPGAEPYLTTSMKSFGEGDRRSRTSRIPAEGVRSLETGLSGLDTFRDRGIGRGDDMNVLRRASARERRNRLLVSARPCAWHGGRRNLRACRIDKWFIERLAKSSRWNGESSPMACRRNADNLRMLKAAGFPTSASPADQAGRKRTCAPSA